MVLSDRKIEAQYTPWGYKVAPEGEGRVHCQMATLRVLTRKGFVRPECGGDIFGATYVVTSEGWHAVDQFIRGGYK